MAFLLEQHKMINWLQKKIPIPKQRFFKVSLDPGVEYTKKKVRAKKNEMLFVQSSKKQRQGV
jgi:hypothetical protein